MEISDTGEGIQYVTADSGEQQIYVQQGADGGVAGQSLLQGAQIVDGKLVLPQQYQYVTENGETVMLVYETPDGQQVMAENGEQIVFMDESQGSQESVEMEEDSKVQQTTYIQQVGPDGQTFLQQVTPEQAALAQQQMDMQEAQDGGLVQVTTDEQTGQTTYITTADDDQQQTFVQAGSQDIQPGQSLLLPNLANQRQIHQQIKVSEDGQTSTVVMVSSDGDQQQQPITSMAFMEDGTIVDGDGQVTMATQQDAALLQQQQEGQIATQYTDASGAIQMNMQGEPVNETTEIMQQPDGSSTKIVIKMMKPEEEEEGVFESPAPITVMHIPHDQTTASLNPHQPQSLHQLQQPHHHQVHVQDEGSLAAAQLMAAPESLEPEPEPFEISEEPDEEGRVTRIDPFTGELVKVMPEPEPDIPVLINPEEFETAPDDELSEPLPEVQLTMHKGVAEVNILNMPLKPLVPLAPRTPKAGTPASTMAVTPGNLESARSTSNVTFDEDDDDDSDSDFDEENLTPKVVYERLLAQHRKTKECQVCGDTLDSYPKLKEHLMEHAGYNPCECQICGKILSTSAQRAKHEITHTKTKTPRPEARTSMDGGSPKKIGDENKEKYECDICGRQVGRPEHLKRHKKIHEPGPTWRCIICEYSFKREDLAKDHIKKQHKDALEMEALKDLYEKLQFEENSQLNHKSQWNPRRKSTPKTPKSKLVKIETIDSVGLVENGEANEKAENNETEGQELQEEQDKQEVQDKEEVVEKEDVPVKTPKTPKVKKEPKPPKEKKPPKPQKETPAGMRKSGRTPKPKRMYDFASEEDIIKAENEEDESDEEETSPPASPRKQAKMKVKLDLKKKKKPEEKKEEGDQDTEPQDEQAEDVIPQEQQEEMDQEAEMMETEEEEEDDEYSYDNVGFSESDLPEIRRTVDKTVTVTFQSSQDQQPRGVKRKAAKMDDADEVVIVGVKGPRCGRQWKPFKKAVPSPSPASTPKGRGRPSLGTPKAKATPVSSPASTKPGPASSKSGRKVKPTLKVQLSVSPKKKLIKKETPKSTATRGRPSTRKSGGTVKKAGRGTFLKTLGVVKKESNRYEDDEFVYFDDDEEDILDGATAGDSVDSDEIIVVRSTGKRGRPKKIATRGAISPKKGSAGVNSPKPRKKTTEDSTPIRRGGMKMPIVLLTRTDVG